MLSLMFNPQEFFLPEELLPLKKRGRNRSSSSTSALPQAFEIGESSREPGSSTADKESLLEPIYEHKEQPGRTIGSEGAVRLIRWFERTESVFSRSNCIEDCKKMEDEFYHLTVKGNDLKAYVRRLHGMGNLIVPLWLPDSGNDGVFIEGLPRSMKGMLPPLNLKL
ncbi:hypothetical protein Tco_0765906 [Tanacetum coccineum]